MTLTGADLGQWREPEPTGKVAVHFVNADAELRKRVVLPPAKFDPAFIAKMCTKYAFPVTALEMASCLTEMSDLVVVAKMDVDGQRLDDLFEDELDSWKTEDACKGYNVFVMPPSKSVREMVLDSCFGGRTPGKRLLSSGDSGLFGSSQSSGVFGASTHSLTSCSSGGESVPYSEHDLDATLEPVSCPADSGLQSSAQPSFAQLHFFTSSQSSSLPPVNGSQCSTLPPAIESQYSVLPSATHLSLSALPPATRSSLYALPLATQSSSLSALPPATHPSSSAPALPPATHPPLSAPALPPATQSHSSSSAPALPPVMSQNLLPGSRSTQSASDPSTQYAVTEEQQLLHAVCATSEAGGSGGFDRNPLPGSRSSQSASDPSTRYAVTEEQQLLLAVCATSEAGGSTAAGCDDPVSNEPGQRFDSADLFDAEEGDGDMQVIEGLIAEKTTSSYYREGQADSLVWHLGCDVGKVMQRKYVLTCLMTPDEMLDIWKILGEVATPTEMVQMRRDFCQSVFLKMLEGDAGARKTFYLAKRIMFTLLYNFMIAKMGWSPANNKHMGMSVWWANQWCRAQYWCAPADAAVHVPPFLFVCCADDKCRGLWNQHVYSLRRVARRNDLYTGPQQIKTADPKALELSLACAEPPVPDHTALLSGSKVLRDACAMIQVIGARHLSASMLDDLAESSPLFVVPQDLNKERGLVRLTYIVRRAKVDSNRQYFDATEQIRLCPALFFNREVAYDEFVRMRQCVVRYSPTSAVYTRECFEYLVSRMGSAAIYHFSKRNRMTAAKGVLGSLPVTGQRSFEYPSYFALPYDDFLVTGVRCAVHYAARDSQKHCNGAQPTARSKFEPSVQEMLRTIIISSVAGNGKQGALDAVAQVATTVTMNVKMTGLPIMVVPTACGTFASLMSHAPYLVLDGHVVECRNAADLICRWFEAYWVFNLHYPTEMYEFYGVMEALYGFLPVEGGMYGPLTMTQPKFMAKKLIAIVSQVMQMDGYILAGVKLNNDEREQRTHIMAHSGSPRPPRVLLLVIGIWVDSCGTLGVALPNGQQMRSLKPVNQRLVKGNSIARAAKANEVTEAARLLKLGEIAAQQSKSRVLKDSCLGDATVIINMNEQLAHVGSSLPESNVVITGVEAEDGAALANLATKPPRPARQRKQPKAAQPNSTRHRTQQPADDLASSRASGGTVTPSKAQVTAPSSRVLRSGASPRLTTLRQEARSPVVKDTSAVAPATPSARSSQARSSQRLVSQFYVVKAPQTSAAAHASPSARSSLANADVESPSKIVGDVARAVAAANASSKIFSNTSTSSFQTQSLYVQQQQNKALGARYLLGANSPCADPIEVEPVLSKCAFSKKYSLGSQVDRCIEK